VVLLIKPFNTRGRSLLKRKLVVLTS